MQLRLPLGTTQNLVEHLAQYIGHSKNNRFPGVAQTRRSDEDGPRRSSGRSLPVLAMRALEHMRLPLLQPVV